MQVLGCQSTVPLGSECIRFERGCGTDVSPGTDGMDAAIALPDAAASAVDARVPEDAGLEPPPPDAQVSEPDAAVTGTMGIRNGSFEITSEPPKAGTLDPITNETEIAPWRWCAGKTTVDQGFDMLTATDGQWMVSLSFSVGPAILVQELEKPLVPGARYTFAVDAARSHDGPDDVRLELIGTNGTCTSANELAQTPKLTDSALVTYCLTFEPREADDHVALRMNPLGLTATVFADNLREVAACP